jgi:hypothetical protein
MGYQTLGGTDVKRAPPRDREALGTDALMRIANRRGAALDRGSLARAEGILRARAARRRRGQWLRERVGEKLGCKTAPIETPGRRIAACHRLIDVGKTITLAKLAARAVCLSRGACAW